MKIVVDTDDNELKKHTLSVDIPVLADAGEFIRGLLSSYHDSLDCADWVKHCQHYRKTFPTIIPQRQAVGKKVDSYNFFDVLSDCAADDTIFVFGNGTACVSSYQSLRLKGSQKVVVNSGCAAMGYDLPAAIGAWYASHGKPVICVTGDGSMQMNIQELQTIIHNKIPLKLFVLNNDGYISIRNTQRVFFGGNFVGSGRESGVSCPDTLKIAEAYGFTGMRISNQDNLKEQLQLVLQCSGPVICEVMLDPEEKMEPKLSSEKKPDGRMVSKPLEDMYPFLDRGLFQQQMLVKSLQQ